MIAKLFDINVPGHSIKCKLYCNEPRNINEFVLSLHGFAGHRENGAAEKFAVKLLSKTKKTGVITFDLPAHGSDVTKIISLDACENYINIVRNYLKEQYDDPKVSVYATSFGGYLTLRYLDMNGNPFDKIALRCPAVTMFQAATSNMITEKNWTELKKGRPASIGFDRKVTIDQHFLDEVRNYDVTKRDFMDFADDMLIIHGTKDEVIPFDVSKKFAEDNVIEFIAVEKADHRFQNPDCMNEAIAEMIKFLNMK
ncbi:MAG: alpha/beta hydrolase [Firmicutes bacterium]|nr:alpha/beta hydrolase [Bacillota bacterium]